MTQSEQSRADAMADVETLQLFCQNGGSRFLRRTSPRYNVVSAAVRDAAAWGWLAVKGRPDFSEHALSMAVRAAFRAVPELRSR